MDTLFVALRVVVSLGAVFGALWFFHRWLTKGRPGTTKAKHVTVISKTGLGAKAGIAVVEAGGRRYLLGVTEHQVSLLDRVDGGGAAETVEEALGLDAEGHVTLRSGGELAAVTATVPVLLPRRSFEHALAAAARQVLPIEPTVPVQVITMPTSLPKTMPAGATDGLVALGLDDEPDTATAVRQVLPPPYAGEPLAPSGAEAPPRAVRLPPRYEGEELAPGSDAEPLPAGVPGRGGRAARRSAPIDTSPLAGSILSPKTWRQAGAAIKALR